MDRKDIAFLKEFREKVDQYLFLGYAPSERRFLGGEGLKKMREALKNPEFKALRDTIIKMEPRAHKLLAESHVDNIWSESFYSLYDYIKFRVFDLVTNNRTVEKIDKDFFLDKIDEALNASQKVVAEGVMLFLMSGLDNLAGEVYEAVQEVAREHGLVVHPVDSESSDLAELSELLEESEFFIVDLTDSRPGTYFKAGYLQKMGNPIYIAQKGTYLEFTPPGYPVILFETKYELRRKLSEQLETLERQTE